MLALECENIEPYALYLLGNEFVVTTTTGQTFNQLEWQEDDHDDGNGNGNGNTKHRDDTPCYTWQTYELATGTCNIANLKGTFA